MRDEGWTIWKCHGWTRKGTGTQRNTNIDIILTKNINNERIEVNWLPY